jgi:hypothetical protein
MSTTSSFNLPEIINDILDHVHLSARMFEFATKATSSAFTNTAAQKVVGTPQTLHIRHQFYPEVETGLMRNLANNYVDAGGTFISIF